MVKELRFGTMDLRNTQVNFSKARSKAKVNLNGRMEATTKVALSKVSSKVSANIISQTLIKFIKENSEMVIWKEKELKYGQMERNMKEISKMVKKTVKALLNGLTATNTLEAGDKASNTALEYGAVPKTVEKRDKVNGLMEKDTDGSLAWK